MPRAITTLRPITPTMPARTAKPTSRAGRGRRSPRTRRRPGSHRKRASSPNVQGQGVIKRPAAARPATAGPAAAEESPARRPRSCARTRIGGITGRIGNDVRFAAHEKGPKLKAKESHMLIDKNEKRVKVKSEEDPWVDKPWVIKAARGPDPRRQQARLGARQEIINRRRWKRWRARFGKSRRNTRSSIRR